MVRTYFAESEPSQKTTFEKRLLQLSLFLPFVVPAIGILIFRLPPESRTFLSNIFGGVLGVPVVISIYAIFYGGIPYVVLVAAALLWTRGKSDQQVHRMLWLLPLIFAPLFWLFWIIVSLLLQLSGAASSSPAGVGSETGFALVPLIVGYAYVLPISLVYLMIKTVRAD